MVSKSETLFIFIFSLEIICYNIVRRTEPHRHDIAIVGELFLFQQQGHQSKQEDEEDNLKEFWDPFWIISQRISPHSLRPDL